MSEGDVTVLPHVPVTLDLSRLGQRSLIKLYSQNGGHHLRILPDGTVNGGRLEHDPYEILRLTAVSAGVVVIKGETTGRYLAMDKNGRLFGSNEALLCGHYNITNSGKQIVDGTGVLVRYIRHPKLPIFNNNKQTPNDECYFLDKFEENNYNTYRSQKYCWYVGLKRNGHPKLGPDTHPGQKAIFFLPRSASSV